MLILSVEIMNISPEGFNLFLAVMAALAVVVFAALHFVDAGYGKFYSKAWGPAISNRLGWVLMEAPVFIAMIALWLLCSRKDSICRLVFLLLFELHYFQRSFIFPFLIKGRSRMPLSIVLMGAVFNTLNALMQGGWLFYVSPAQMYPTGYLLDPRFIAGTALFFAGMFINIQSDSIIRHLRKPGDSAHHLPQKGLFRYVSSANYFGELVEWIGFAVLPWSAGGARRPHPQTVSAGVSGRIQPPQSQKADSFCLVIIVICRQAVPSENLCHLGTFGRGSAMISI